MPYSFLCLLLVSGLFMPGQILAKVKYNSNYPPAVFAAQELKEAMRDAGKDDLEVLLVVKDTGGGPEAFEIRIMNPGKVTVIGSDANGAMYGGLEVADLLRLALPIENVKRSPFVKKRGIKFNIPWDARTPSYDDTGDNAQKNIETIWDFEGFWNAVSR